MQQGNLQRWIVGSICCVGLASVYMFQRWDVAGYVGFVQTPLQKFIVNRTIRFVLNDLFMIGIIFALFVERKYVIFALWVQGFGIVFLLIPYFILKTQFPSYNGPLINFLHRLILNPILILLLIPAFFYQRKNATRDK